MGQDLSTKCQLLILQELANSAGQWLQAKGWSLTTAESCTGGGIAFTVTQVSGSSDWFDRSFVTYSNQSKHQLLDVPLRMLEEYGAVSEQVAQAMAQGALAKSESNIALAVTGIAGPGGGTAEKPVGTVCFAKATEHGIVTVTRCFEGDRSQVRYKSMIFSLETLIYL